MTIEITSVITMRVIIRCMFGVDEGPRLEELRVLVVEYMNLMLAPELAARELRGYRRIADR